MWGADTLKSSSSNRTGESVKASSWWASVMKWSRGHTRIAWMAESLQPAVRSPAQDCGRNESIWHAEGFNPPEGASSQEHLVCWIVESSSSEHNGKSVKALCW